MLKILINALIGIILIFVWLKFVNLSEIISTISKVDLKMLLVVFLFMLLSPVIRAIRLKVFLSEIKNIRLLDLIFLNGVAMMLNFFIPIRAGEIAKGIYLNTHYNLNFGKAIIWVFLDRFVDFLVILLLAATLVLFIPTNLSQGFAKIVDLIFILAIIAAYLAIFQVTLAKKLINFLKHIFIFKSIKIYFVRFTSFILESFSILKRKPKDLALMIGLTILSYGADAGVWYFTFLALGAPQEYLKMYLGQLLSALTYLIPAAPGYIGSAEASGLLILSGIFNLDKNLASAMIVLFHVMSALFVLVFGLTSVFSLKIDLRLILKKALKRE